MWPVFDRAIDLLLQFWTLLLPACVIEPYQRAIVIRLGKFHRELEPGFHWIIPFGVDRVLDQTVVPSVHCLSPQSLTTRDGKCCAVQAVLTWRISDIRKLLLDVDDANSALIDAAHGIIAVHVAGADWGQLTTPDFLAGVHRDIRKRAFRWGIEVLAVQFSDLQQCRSLRLWQEHR